MMCKLNNYLKVFACYFLLFVSFNTYASFTFTAHDTAGQLLNFSTPLLIVGTGTSNGAGTASAGAGYYYTNVITVDGVQVDAIVSVDQVVNATLNMFDDPHPNPVASDSTRSITNGTTVSYITSFGAIVPEGAIFAPQITATNKTQNSYVQFTIKFQDTKGNPVVLKNVYNNTLDVESVEYNEFGGFQSYQFSSDYQTNTLEHMVTTPGMNGNIRFSNSFCTGNPGLFITDSSRVQTKFDTITQITIVNGQFANNAVPDGNGGLLSCTNITTRYYGTLFVMDDFTQSGSPAVQWTAPTVNALITSITKPTITGTIGGTVTTDPTGSAIAAGDTFSVTVNGVVYTYPNANLQISGTQWALTIPTALAIGTYEVTAIRNGILVDQTKNELEIIVSCVSPQVANAAGTACTSPPPGTDVICHTGDTGDMNSDGVENTLDDAIRHYTKILSNMLSVTGHETHPHDYAADANGKCPDDPVVCVLPKLRNATTNQCYTPLTCALPSVLNATATACVTSSVPTVITQVSATTTPTVTGTIGSLALATNETFAVTLNGVTYSAANANLTISGLNWTLNASALTRGTIYNVVATRDGTLVDATSNELTVLSVPTVVSQTTTNLTPTITGTIGNASLGSSETFTVTVNNVIYSKGDGKLSVSGTAWTLVVPSTNGLKTGTTYDVVTLRAGTLTDTTTGELVITAITCTAPQVVNTTTNTCYTQQTACTMIFSPLVVSTIPTGSDYDGTKLSLCHFPTSSSPAQVVSVTVANLGSYLNYHGDSIWENGKTCPNKTTDCDVDPDVDSKSDYDSCQTTVTGHAGTNRSLTINVYDSTNVLRTTGTATITGSSNTNPWSYKLTTLLAAGKYNVETVGETGLKDTTTNELTINKSTIPTVNTTTSTDQIKPTITGTVGTSTTLTISIVGSTGTTVTSGSAVISGTTWTFTPSVLIPAGTYNIIATGDATHCGLTDTTTNELTITTASYPTVNIATTNDKIAPSLSGTTGISTSLTISIMDSTNTLKVSGNATISGNNWTYTPSVAIAAGTYNIVATGDAAHGNLVDQTTNELTVTATTIPSVNTVTTTDKAAATLTGTPGTSTTLQIKVLDSSKAIKNSGAATIIGGTTWTYKTIALPVGTYDVVAQGDATSGSLVDNTANELVVTASVVPTVDTVTTNDKIPPKLTGTVGTSQSLKISIVDSKNSKITSGSAKITGTTWSYTPSAAIPANVYDVVATGDSASGGLVDATKNELTVLATVPPTVNILTTNDITAPTLTGTAGSSQSLTISIKSSAGVTVATGSATITGTTWSYTTPSPIAAGIYEVSALGDAVSGSLKDSTTNELTVINCKLPLVYSASGTSCISPIPTVVKQTIETLSSISPTITGTVGVVALMSNETFTITVAGKTYDRTNSALSFSGVNWTLTVPATSPITFGFYDVVVARNTTSKDQTTNELIINKQCILPLLPDGTGRGCLAASAFPAVDVLTTDDTTPTITGSAGDTVLSATEMFGVTVNGITYDRSSSQLSFNGTLWSLNIPLSDALNPGVYDVIAIRGDVSVEGAAIMDRTTNELTITACNSPKQIDATTGDCTNGSPTPTVDSLTTDKTQPTLTGTVGTTSLGNTETFTISVDGQTYDKTTIIISGLKWSVNVTTDIQPGTYDVVALRAGQYKDQTTNELSITGDMVICDNGTTKTISKAMWDSSKLGASYYLGTCNAPACSTPPAATDPANCSTPLPDPIKDDVKCQDPTITAAQIAALNCVLPSIPSELADESVSIYTGPNGVNYCVSSTISNLNGSVSSTTTGVDSSSSITKSTVTIKKARIANSTTSGGQVCLYNSSNCPNTQIPPVIKYGTLSVSGTIDISGATVNKNVATGVNITGATLTGTYIDTGIDYINADGTSNPAGNYIPVYGGTTLKTPTTNITSTNKAIVTSGVIVSGTDPQGNPVRGEITNATYDTDVINAASVLTKGRRVQGTVSNAKITNARLTTVAGVGVLDQGTIISGDMQSDVSTYGSVINTTVQATTILMSSSQCSSAGSIIGVGSRGQLMWKEVIKKKSGL